MFPSVPLFDDFCHSSESDACDTFLRRLDIRNGLYVLDISEEL